MIRIEVKGKLPSLNQLYSSPHWTKRKEIVDLWHTLILASVRAKKVPKPLQTPILVYCTQFSKGRLLDADNLLGAKLLNDVLKTHGYLPDDSPKYVPTVILSSKKGKEDKVVYLIMPASGT